MAITPVTREEKILSGADIQPRTRMEYFLKKASENGGGESGGPDVPSFTAADIGKVLTVVDYGDGEEHYIVPPQTRDFSTTVVIENADVTAFVLGATATLFVSASDGSIPSTQYSVTCTDEGLSSGALKFSSDTCPVTIIKVSNETVIAESVDPMELTIYLSQVTPNPQLAWVSAD